MCSNATCAICFARGCKWCAPSRRQHEHIHLKACEQSMWGDCTIASACVMRSTMQTTITENMAVHIIAAKTHIGEHLLSCCPPIV